MFKFHQKHHRVIHMLLSVNVPIQNDSIYHADYLCLLWLNVTHRFLIVTVMCLKKKKKNLSSSSCSARLRERLRASCTSHTCSAGGTQWALHSRPHSSASCRTSPPSHPSSSSPPAVCHITASTQRYVWPSLPELTPLQLPRPLTSTRVFWDWHVNVDNLFLKKSIIIMGCWTWPFLTPLYLLFLCVCCVTVGAGSVSHGVRGSVQRTASLQRREAQILWGSHSEPSCQSSSI